MLKKPHLSDCCYKKNGDFNPTYHDWLVGERETEREIERERERWCPQQKIVKWVRVADESERETDRDIQRQTDTYKERERERERQRERETDERQ